MSYLFQSLPLPSPELEACVIVPAKNEAARLSSALTALASQMDLNGQLLGSERWEVLLLINNSTDDSFSVADHFKQFHPRFPLRIAECHLPAQHAHIGHVRKLLMDSAHERLSFQPKPSSLILSTDADTEVATDWIAQNLAEVRRGAEAVGGRISLQPRDLQELDGQTRTIHLGNDQYHLLLSWLEDHCDPQAHDPWPRHYQHFGSSLAVKPEIYRQVGGLPAQEFLEDVALHEALLRQDIKFRHSPAVCVRTSGRLQGKTAIGLAEQLSRWSKGPSAIVVPSVLLWQTLFSLQRRLRALWRRMQAGKTLRQSALEKLSKACGARLDELQEALACQWFGTAFERLRLRSRLENGPLRGKSQQLLGDAIFQLQKQMHGSVL